MALPTAIDLEFLLDEEVLDLLDLVSGEVKRRNGLRPASAGKAAVDIMKTLSEMATLTKR